MSVDTFLYILFPPLINKKSFASLSWDEKLDFRGTTLIGRSYLPSLTL